VQLTMIGTGLWRGERLESMQWLGVAIATAGLVAMKLPLGVFPVAVRIVSLFIVPVAFINVVPVAVFTGHMSAWWLVGVPLAAVAAVALAAGVYRLGLRAYDSAGH